MFRPPAVDRAVVRLLMFTLSLDRAVVRLLMFTLGLDRAVVRLLMFTVSLDRAVVRSLLSRRSGRRSRRVRATGRVRRRVGAGLNACQGCVETGPAGSSEPLGST
jgi:hypothetical protein